MTPASLHVALPPTLEAARRDPNEWDDPRGIEAFELDEVEFDAPHEDE